jgi:RimJ/RimL family protein N-acetyltransferase
VIETERLLLRRIEPRDHEAIHRLNADPDFTRHLAGVQTREQSEAHLERWERHWAEHGFGILAVEWRDTGEFVGRVGLQYHRVWPDDPEVGWGIDPAFWGRGIATEGGAACVEWGLGALGFEQLVSIATEANTASRNVMRKLGFVKHAEVESEWGTLWVHRLRPVPDVLARGR